MTNLLKVSERFSGRVTNYIKYRPDYPAQLFDLLQQLVPDSANKICADCGSGTGILSSKLLSYFAKVYAVEANNEMCQAAEALLAGKQNFISINAHAENTTLPANSIDLITAAQAFHWFKREEFKNECRRILKPNAAIALIWNNRQNDTPFLQTYDRLLNQYATDYQEINHQNIGESEFADFYSAGYQLSNFANSQTFDLNGLFGRLDSCSYAPKAGTVQFAILREELSKAFYRYAQNGLISFNYQCQIYFGRID